LGDGVGVNQADSALVLGIAMTDLTPRELDLSEPVAVVVGRLRADLAGARSEIQQLRTALRRLINDIHEYERVNNLSPNPPRMECWDSVLEARHILADGDGAPKPTDLTPRELDLLKWLGESEYSQYGECYGKDLDTLVAKKLAQIHLPGEHQNFIANDFAGTRGIMYQAVSLTENGRALLVGIEGSDE
jgi:hypothetical protein